MFIEKLFLKEIEKSFQEFLKSGSRSNKKLYYVHGFFAKLIKEKLGNKYKVFSLGIGENKEKSIKGRYSDKNVDILIKNNKKEIAGLSIKFVMQNYKQNKVNYFENLLGETANIRTKHIPYFHIFLIFEKIPYYTRDKKTNSWLISKWEDITEEDFSRYKNLSRDDVNIYLHTPNKTLIVLLKHKKEIPINLINKSEYKKWCIDNQHISLSKKKINFDSNVIFNDASLFLKKVVHTIKAI